MLFLFTLFIQAKYGFDANKTFNIYGIFMAFVYFLPLLGGIIATGGWVTGEPYLLVF